MSHEKQKPRPEFAAWVRVLKCQINSEANALACLSDETCAREDLLNTLIKTLDQGREDERKLEDQP